MPNYTYRSKDPECKGFDTYQGINDPPLTECPACGARVYRAITMASAGFRFRHGMKGDMRDYRDDLARFAGDPEAYTDGPKSVQRLIDKRRRQGWTLGEHFSGPTEPKSTTTSEERIRIAYKRAEAKGFVPDAERN